MPIDPTIPLGFKFPETPTSANPISFLSNWVGIQNSLNQNKLFNQTFAAKQRAGEILSSSPDLDSALNTLAHDPVAGPFAGEIMNNIRQAQLAQTQIGKAQAETQGENQKQAQTGLEAFQKSMPALLADPSQWDKIAEANLATLSPEARKRVAPAINAIGEALTADLPSDPQARTEVLHNRMVGMSLGAGFSDLSSVLGKSETVDTGAHSILGVRAPVQQGGGFTAASTIQRELAPQVVSGDFGPGGAASATQIGARGPAPPVVQVGQGNSLGAQVGPSPTTNTITSTPAASSLGAVAPRPASAAPASAGLVGLPLAQKEYIEKRTGKMADYESELDDRVLTGGTFRRNMQEIVDAAKDAKTGGGAELYMAIGQGLQALGANTELVDKMANGSLAGSQVIDKASLSNTMNQLKQQLTGIGGSRINQQEFVAQLSKNPNLATDPRAVETVFNLWNDFYARDRAEQKALDAYKTSGSDIGRWPSVWADSEYMKNFAPIARMSGAQMKGREQDKNKEKPAASRPPLAQFLRP